VEFDATNNTSYAQHVAESRPLNLSCFGLEFLKYCRVVTSLIHMITCLRVVGIQNLDLSLNFLISVKCEPLSSVDNILELI
jgi:hypothetical protein